MSTKNEKTITTIETRKATVSVRNMAMETWKQARKGALDKGMTMTQYIEDLILSDNKHLNSNDDSAEGIMVDGIDLVESIDLLIKGMGRK